MLPFHEIKRERLQELCLRESELSYMCELDARYNATVGFYWTLKVETMFSPLLDYSLFPLK